MKYEIGEVVRNLPTNAIGVVAKQGHGAYLVIWEWFGEVWTDEDKIELWRGSYYDEMHQPQEGRKA